MAVFGYFISPITVVGIITVGYNPVLYTTTEDQGFVVLNITVIDPPFGSTPRPFTLVVNTHDDIASTFFLAHKNVIMTKIQGQTLMTMALWLEKLCSSMLETPTKCTQS